MNESTNSNNRKTWEFFILTGSEKGFSPIYYSYFDLLYYVGLKYTSNTQIIEDSIQNIFLYLLKSRNKLKHITNVKAYLLKSFRRQLFLDLKKQKKFFFPEQLIETSFDYFNGTEQNTPEKEEQSELQSAIKKSIQNLSDKQQEIIYLRYDCELSYEEISNILGISVDSCYKSVYRSIKIMKTNVKQMLVKSTQLFCWFIFNSK
ncbi:MAG: hypothetical protein A2W90_13440 [Bacteroidetes bacterium GWF2_42_66]|nr:MAG: hypothetical protein A2W92_14155 [Bacteroidetes bacterium GWA2_42_15]OFX97268.1 MAG: hypothetical protein A2W89_00615 [Bacteroidetes bacterium GWE2_42_39]OFY39905.1 MAG: hypothetical protein A2W90_13440 [Bacteroidetes bacterium GWF2_42_66]HBL78085.1 hypothetical protein [Prolixibacteraceae bacterium]HCR91970.1 hypothetical protein [Prolixibacteraceae bacterium]